GWISRTLNRRGARVESRLHRLDIYKVRIPAETSVEEAAASLALDPAVLFAEPNYIGRAQTTPNDNLFKYQYALANTGQAIGDVPGSPQGKAGADIKATLGWEETTGSEDVKIAVVDSGVDLVHPDLKNQIAGPGRDFVNDDMDASDDYFHGTAVAGVAAAETNNNEGIAGVAWKARILPVKVLDAAGLGTAEHVADGIRWAADQGARVINLSLGFEEASWTLLTAVQYAFGKNAVVIAAAGSDGGPVQYPAGFSEYVLAVAATDYDDIVWEMSNSGTEVDVAAPGVDVLSTVPTWFFGPSVIPYVRFSGTSIAAAHVSGLAALLFSIKPWLTPEQIMEIIRFTAEDVNSAGLPGKDVRIGYGRINLEKALVPQVLGLDDK
ncbi:MAG: S8 family serine peptidase, partial [Candidatus Aminicenantes bacterium]|nr:S8 family serine peptidase [Candidatus Aminicenantes bacterium]